MLSESLKSIVLIYNINPITLECSDRVLKLLIYNYKIMKKITKKEFIDTLCNHESIQCGVLGHDLNESQKEILRKMTWESMCYEGVIRRVDRRMSNSIMFTDRSYLYFNVYGKKSYYRIGNVIIERVQVSHSQNHNAEYISILCYLINY